ncbi:MAG: class I SAM-dependent methyltransferase [Alphaproteobacteria bacterium]|nr:class I SAM-dependent methyltransferase [Alphaproteobacteria bacterium]
MKISGMSDSEDAAKIGYVKRVYAFLAPFYDWTFGWMLLGRRCVVRHINKQQGRVLEVGVGTGLTFPYYAHHLKITGIDISPEMLDRARQRATRGLHPQIEGIHEMDASDLNFHSGRFQVVVAMYLLTIVENPEKIMSELERVCAPGGEVIVLSHFADKGEGWRSRIEKWGIPIGRFFGWQSRFFADRIFCCENLQLVETRSFGPFGWFTMFRFKHENQLDVGDLDRNKEDSLGKMEKNEGENAPKEG